MSSWLQFIKMVQRHTVYHLHSVAKQYFEHFISSYIQSLVQSCVQGGNNVVI